MRVGSLFSGIGGLDLGLERAGMEIVWNSEIDPYACRVLAKHWPHVPNLGDITLIDWSTVEPVDLICGGYPCQPFSLAGARAGTSDARHLWPYFADALRHLRPRWALLENVPGHLSMGFGQVLGDLAGLGYDTDWDCIPAAAVGAPHLRYRIFVVADSGSPRRRQDPRGSSGDEGQDEGRSTHDDHLAVCDGESRGAPPLADTNCAEWGAVTEGRHRTDRDDTGRQEATGRPWLGREVGALADAHPSRRTVIQGRSTIAERSRRRAADGGGWWATEPDVGGTLDGFSAWLDGPGHSHLLDLAHGNAEEDRSGEVLRCLLGPDGSGEVGERSPGGQIGVSAETVLLTYVRQLSALIDEGRHAPLAGSAAAQAGVRGVRIDQEPPRPSRRRRSVEQRPDQSSDALRALPQLLARHAEAAWSAYRRESAPAVLSAWSPGWEDGIARVAHGVPSRVDRLKCLGNAVVPAVAQFVGERIMEAAA